MATIDIRTIKVLLDTNIPGKEIVPLTKSILYQPKMNTGKWNEYPFFTMDAEYPEGYLSRFTYEQQMEFFFVKQKMIETLRTKSNITERPNSVDLKTQDQITKEAKSSSEKALEIEKTKLEKEQQMKLIDENERKNIVSLTETKDNKLRALESNTMYKLLGFTVKYKQDPSDKKYKFYVEERSEVLDLGYGPITTYDKFIKDYQTFMTSIKKNLKDVIAQKTITE